MQPAPLSADPPAVSPRRRTVDRLVTEFMAAKERDEAERLERAVRSRKRKYGRMVLAAVVLVAAIAAPLPEPKHTPRVHPASFSQASARLTLTLASRRVEAFRTRYMRLPNNLVDAGVYEPLMSYERTEGANYVLRLRGEGVMYSFDSSMSPVILADDIKVINATTGS